jgi:hypothetical protein
MPRRRRANDGKPRTYTRGAWGNPADLEGLFEVR